MTTAYILAHYLYLTNDILSDTKQIARRRAQGTSETREQVGWIRFETPHVYLHRSSCFVIRNKLQLIDLICEDMAFHKDDISQHNLVLTGSEPVPVKINRGVIIKRQDMKTKQEEADTMVVQQVEEVKAKKVLVVAEDTDIIVYLFFCFTSVAKEIFQLQPLS